MCTHRIFFFISKTGELYAPFDGSITSKANVLSGSEFKCFNIYAVIKYRLWRKGFASPDLYGELMT